MRKRTVARALAYARAYEDLRRQWMTLGLHPSVAEVADRMGEMGCPVTVPQARYALDRAVALGLMRVVRRYDNGLPHEYAVVLPDEVRS